MKLLIKKSVHFILITYISLCVFLFIFQRKLEYQPQGVLESPISYSLTEVSRETLLTHDDLKLAWWYHPAEDNEKIMVYFHGNAGNLGGRANKFKLFIEEGDFALAALTYRGYPGSEGSPKEKDIIKDALAFIERLKILGYSEQDMIFYGESLGSGVVLQIAAQFEPYAIILDAPFTSALAVARENYWYVPLNILMLDKFLSLNYVDQVKSPTLIIHGTADSVTPFSQGQALHDALNVPKKLIAVPDADHLDYSNEFLLEQIEEFLESE